MLAAFRELVRDLAYLRWARREVRRRAPAEGRWRPAWWWKPIFWGSAAFGVYLVVTGDTVERVIGAMLLLAPIVVLGVTVWVFWKARVALRQHGGRPDALG